MCYASTVYRHNSGFRRGGGGVGEGQVSSRGSPLSHFDPTYPPMLYMDGKVAALVLAMKAQQCSGLRGGV